MSTSIHRSVWDWLRSCPSVKKLSFNYGTEGNHSMVLRPTRTVEADYAGGQKLYAYLVELVVFKPITFDPNDSGNIDMLESVDEISDWIQNQIDEENYPVLPEGCTYSDFAIYENQTEFAIAQDGMYAKYVIPFTIQYLK